MMFLLAYHGRSWWVRPKDIDIAKARSSTRINYESKGGPNMGMGHSKGKSHVKWDILCMVDKDIYSFCPSMGRSLKDKEGRFLVFTECMIL
jgi:hypothetical protein